MKMAVIPQQLMQYFCKRVKVGRLHILTVDFKSTGVVHRG